MRFGSLFTGIGGLDLALESFGHDCAWQVEIDPYARGVLEYHWPTVHRHADVRTVGEAELSGVDIICGGFPCQDISNAGARVGIAGERSGLWSEFARIVRVLRPRYVFVENVAALLARGLGRVLGDLAESGYDAEWDCLRAADVGAPHLRDRIFILAYALRGGVRDQHWREFGTRGEGQALTLHHGTKGTLAHTNGERFEGRQESDVAAHESEQNPPRWSDAMRCGADVANASGARRRSSSRPPESRDGGQTIPEGEAMLGRCRRDVADTQSDGWNQGRPEPARQQGRPDVAERGWWEVEPDICRVVDGVPARVDRLRCLGNAVVPQQAALAWQVLMNRIGRDP